jgi:hypothetical protein
MVFEEEKKTAESGRGGCIGKGSVIDKVVESDPVSRNALDDEDSDSPLVELPQAIARWIEGGVDRRYRDEDELQNVLDEAGVGDLNVVLDDGVARLVMPKEQHNYFITSYLEDLIHSHYNWALVSGTHLVHLAGGSEKPRRMPDINIWSYKRLEIAPSGRRTTRNDCRMPDVVIQFSWKNKTPYEQGAIDDIMNYGLDREGGAPSQFPRLGYLIKVLLSKKRTLPSGNPTQDLQGIQIYRQPKGTTLEDALSNQKGAHYWIYKPNDAIYSRQVEITVTAEDLGIVGLEAWYFRCRVGNMVLRASEILKDMQAEQLKRQNDGLKY